MANRDPIFQPSVNKGGNAKMASSGRIFSIKGPKSSVAKGGLSPRTSAPIVNGK